MSTHSLKASYLIQLYSKRLTYNQDTVAEVMLHAASKAAPSGSFATPPQHPAATLQEAQAMWTGLVQVVWSSDGFKSSQPGHQPCE